MKNLKSLLLTFAILLLSFTNTKAQDDCKDCGIVINNILVDSLTCWNAKEMFLVFPYNPEWAKYDLIEVGMVNVWDQPEKLPFCYLMFTKAEFSDFFSKGYLGAISIPLTKSVYICNDREITFGGSGISKPVGRWDVYEKDKKSDPNTQSSKSKIVEVRGRRIKEYVENYNGGVLVKTPVYDFKPTVLWRSKPIPMQRYAVKNNKLVDETYKTFVSPQTLGSETPTGSCSNKGKAYPYKIEAVNYSDKYFIIKK